LASVFTSAVGATGVASMRLYENSRRHLVATIQGVPDGYGQFSV
jgi:hypothetical protein